MSTLPSFPKHASVMVPLETWCFQSPLLRKNGQRADLGLLAEAMIYYDHIFLNIQLPSDLDALVEWFARSERQKDLVGFFRDGIFHVYHCAFLSTAIRDGDSFSIWNIQGQDQAAGDTFAAKVLSATPLDKYLHHARHRGALMSAISERVIEAKSSEFGPAIENARADSVDPDRSALNFQSLIDEIYPLLGEKKPPEVKVTVTPDEGQKHITYNINFSAVSTALGVDANFHLGSPLVAAAVANRTIQSASMLKSDLYLGSPLSGIVGDKLYEVQSRSGKPQDVISQLVTEVEFPNIRQLVNEGKIGLNEVLLLRDKAKRFRRWLQSESERDRNALIAYHHEVAEESGMQKAGRSTLKLFGLMGGAASGVIVATAVAGPGASPIGAVGGAVAGEMASGSLQYLFDRVSDINGGWRPVVFGNWMSARIKRLLDSDSSSR